MFWFKKKPPAKPTREQLLAQAHANAKIARETIGEETLDRIAAAMRKKQESAIEQAKAQIKSMDKDKVADHIKLMLDDK